MNKSSEWGMHGRCEGTGWDPPKALQLWTESGPSPHPPTGFVQAHWPRQKSPVFLQGAGSQESGSKESVRGPVWGCTRGRFAAGWGSGGPPDGRRRPGPGEGTPAVTSVPGSPARASGRALGMLGRLGGRGASAGAHKRGSERP